ncbi:MAG: 3D domain-containing protein [Proteobacteria bacterium]|nr:3D domain-containing protein [Pseudomonadota bacterium]
MMTSPTSAWRTITDLLGGLVDRVDRLLGRVALGALALLGGCQSAEVIAPTAPAPAEQVVTIPADAAAPDAATPLGSFNITFYYVIGEDEVVARKKPVVPSASGSGTIVAAPANDNQLVGDGDDTLTAAIAPPDLVTVFAGGCEPIAEVSREFASQLDLQGTGKLRDGRVLNIEGACHCERSPCFKVIENQWGTSGNGHPLQPFRTVAVDPKVIKVGTLLHVPLLEGRMMPGREPWGGFVHDGCVVADDTGGGIDGNQLDLFVGRKAYFLGLSGSGGSHAWARHVPVYDGAGICERKGRKIGRKNAAI